MTPDEARQQWYQQMAQEHGLDAAMCMKHADEYAAADYTRLAAHFGRLALGEEHEESDRHPAR